MEADSTRRLLGVVGSPRRDGNTHILVTRVLDGAKAHGASTEVVLLGDLVIRECDGCHACWESKACSKDDDMSALYPRLAEADVLILGTPVYWYAPTALMKAFVDRLVYFNCPQNRPRIQGKSAVVAIPFEEQSLETASLVLQFFEKTLGYLEMSLVGKLVVPGVSRKGEILDRPYWLQQAYDLGKKIATEDLAELVISEVSS